MNKGPRTVFLTAFVIISDQEKKKGTKELAALIGLHLCTE
jgi:hypothetical protein